MPNSNFFKTFSDDYVHPLLENKKFVLALLAMFLPLAGYDAYKLLGTKLPAPIELKALHKPAVAPQTIIQSQDCSKELASHIIKFNNHAKTHN